MDKNELFQIGEVSRLFNVSISILRHYDRIGLLAPEYIDPDTGYRYYSIRQFETLNTIRYLRAIDVPLEDIRVFLENRDAETMTRLLEKQRQVVIQRRRDLELIRKKIDMRLSRLVDADALSLDEIRVIEVPGLRVALLRRNPAPRDHLSLETGIRKLVGDQDTGIVFLGKVGLGLSPENLLQRRFTPYQVVFLLLEEGEVCADRILDLPAGRCVCLRFRGEHADAPARYEALMDYMEQNGLTPSGFSREITLADYGLTGDADKFVTEIQIPFEAAEKADA